MCKISHSHIGRLGVRDFPNGVIILVFTCCLRHGGQSAATRTFRGFSKEISAIRSHFAYPQYCFQQQGSRRECIILDVPQYIYRRLRLWYLMLSIEGIHSSEHVEIFVRRSNNKAHLFSDPLLMIKDDPGGGRRTIFPMINHGVRSDRHRTHSFRILIWTMWLHICLVHLHHQPAIGWVEVAHAIGSEGSAALGSDGGEMNHEARVFTINRQILHSEMNKRLQFLNVLYFTCIVFVSISISTQSNICPTIDTTFNATAALQ